ncbi:MAG TPA: DivIVA domain-containing protein [Ignavibacteriaceae bacterium]|jgi:cell division initiation protein|nr:MAG: Septum site-determining protein DivIVA [Ignavibacteria bacterium ADurb.Bin266]OQY73872.1 MAG: cell division protein DivIVA [Ignavibacteriales bacterium UTCHB2]HQF41964.1 DivIVA domain-containing protein [Ignavibacteriaceae bacterium]HQI41018.1 DivIVA domain-containing protein [Ignavibacteriaceae bacterium]HQJ46687.1 DivIVA domain-containing protein [Ignavibacteriaceae bacterium]
MKISPLEIRQQEFTKKMRGFDPDEVQNFLESLADEVQKINEENGSLKSEVEALTEQINEYKKIEKNLQDTLLKAQENSTKSLEAAKKQTSLMLKEAELKAAQIIEKARENTNDIRNAVVNLREEKDLIIAKLKAIVNSQANLLELKVERAGEEKSSGKKAEDSNKMDIDLNDILNKIL